MSKYRRIKYEDRCQIYALRRGSSQEASPKFWASVESAVSREIHRNRGERGYRFEASGSQKAQAREAIRSKPLQARRCRTRTARLEAKLRQMRWSPEQISGWLKRNRAHPS